MKKLFIMIILIIFLFVLSSCVSYTRRELARIVDEELEEPLSVLYCYFEENSYSFDEARDAFNTVHDIIYSEFY
jgi:hypothetical protein